MNTSDSEQHNRDPDKAVPVGATGGALLFAMLFPSLTAWIYFVVLAGSSPTADGMSYAALATYAASKVIQFAFPLAWVLLIERRRLSIARPTPHGLVLGLSFGFLVMSFTFVAYYAFLRSSPMLASTPEKVLSRIKLFHADTPIRYFLLTLFLAGVHSLMEEYYWRWFVFGELKRFIAPPLAMVLSGLAFMAHHVIILWIYLPGRFWTGVLPFSLCVALGGAAWAWLYQRARTLYAPWLSHLLVDVAILAVGYDMVFVPR